MKNYIKPLFFLLVSLFPAICHAQLIYPVVGTFKGKSAQGMAIWGDNAYLFNDGGGCRVFNLKTKKVTREFLLNSANKNNHANSASFGKEIVKGNSIPLIYISECKSPYRCFVENITDSTSQLVQTIIIKREGTDSIAKDWVVDIKRKRIYGISNLEVVDKTTGNRRYCITAYRLPKIEEGKEIVLTDKDVRDSFNVFFPNVLQGATIYKKYLYMPVGFQKGLEKRLDSKRAVIVINLKKHKIEKNIDLTDITEKEPEDMDFYQGKALLYTGQDGGLYEIKL